MKFPNWFVVAWWVLLLILASTYVGFRHRALLGGQVTAVDTLVLAVALALLVFPLFKEMSIFGVSFKDRIDGLRNELVGLRTELHASVDVKNQIFVPAPPPDSELPAIEERIERSLENALKSRGIKPPVVSDEALKVPDDTMLLFRARYNLERELRRLWHRRLEGNSPTSRRFTPTLQIARVLAQAGLIDTATEAAIREIWSVAAPGIHGEPTTSLQVAFVKDVAPRIISALRAIS
ncbi:MAG: hypothetical protein WBD21_10340 [Candidatus Acidiferrales bacterium]